MIPRDIKAPTVTVPFHKLLKIVAIVDRNDERVMRLIEHVNAENFEVEVSDSPERDVSEDASVGAYIASIDSSCLDSTRGELGRQSQADAGLFPGFSGCLQSLPWIQLRSPRCLSGASGRSHQVLHLCCSRVSTIELFASEQRDRN